MSSPAGHSPVAPAEQIISAMQSAQEGVDPAFDQAQLFEMLGLSAEEPDGRTLTERLLVDTTHPERDFAVSDFFAIFLGERQTPQRVAERRTIGHLIVGVGNLVAVTNERRANPAQESLAKMLGAALDRHVSRESTMCGIARDMALGSTRDDIIRPELRAALRADRELEELAAVYGIAAFLLFTPPRPNRGAGWPSLFNPYGDDPGPWGYPGGRKPGWPPTIY